MNRAARTLLHPLDNGHFQVYRTIPEFRKVRHAVRARGQSVGFVPTMGALHNGHLALIRQAAQENHHVCVSIYVNPTQFGVNEDLNSYPRTWSSDEQKLEEMNVALQAEATEGRIRSILMPTTNDMYPGLPPTSEIDGDGSFVTITPLSRRLEGRSRPVFFRGVATVCMKLLNIVQPERVYFGQKDIQQTFVVKRMMQDFHVDTEMIIGPTVREDDGLAMSSRNVYLGQRRRKMALILVDTLRIVQEAYQQNITSTQTLKHVALEHLTNIASQQDNMPKAKRARFELEYISFNDPDTFDDLGGIQRNRGAIVSIAIKMMPIEDPQPGEILGNGNDDGVVRLIDNIRLRPLSVNADSDSKRMQ